MPAISPNGGVAPGYSVGFLQDAMQRIASHCRCPGGRNDSCRPPRWPKSRTWAPRPPPTSPTSDVKKVNALPGVDRQIVSVDIGKLNEAVGIVHRGKLRERRSMRRRRRRRWGAAVASRAAEPCGAEGGRGRAGGTPAAASITTPRPRVLHHVSGAGTMVTGGRIVGGRKSAPDAAVTTS